MNSVIPFKPNLFFSWKIVFLLTAIGYLGLICWTPVLPSLDGAMHVHNAWMLGESGVSSLVSSDILPNPAGWINITDHLLLLLFSKISDPILAQKAIFLLIYLWGAIAWFRLFQSSDLDGSWSLGFFAVWLGWPWFMGFFNFLLGSALLLSLLPLIRLPSLKRMQMAALLLGVTLLAAIHLYVFATAGLLMICQILASHSLFSLNSLRRCLAFVPGAMVLVLMLWMSDSYSRDLAFTSIFEKLQLLFSGQILKGLDAGKEGRFAFWILLAIALFGISQMIAGIKTKQKIQLSESYWIFLISSCLLLLIIPDHIGAGSYLPYRVVFFVTLLLFPALSTIKSSLRQSWGIMLLLTIGNIGFLAYYFQFLPQHGRLARQLYLSGQQIEAGASILSLSAETHWMHEHYSAYLALGKEAVILDNYEFSSGAFPLILQSHHQYMIGDVKVQEIPCHTLTLPQIGPERQLDYVLILLSSSQSEICQDVPDLLNSQGFQLLTEQEGFQLFRRIAGPDST